MLPPTTTHIELVGTCAVLFKNYDATNINQEISSPNAVGSTKSFTEMIDIEYKSNGDISRILKIIVSNTTQGIPKFSMKMETILQAENYKVCQKLI